MDSTTTRPLLSFDGPRASWEKPTFCGAFSASQMSCSAKACLGLNLSVP